MGFSLPTLAVLHCRKSWLFSGVPMPSSQLASQSLGLANLTPPLCHAHHSCCCLYLEPFSFLRSCIGQACAVTNISCSPVIVCPRNSRHPQVSLVGWFPLGSESIIWLCHPWGHRVASEKPMGDFHRLSPEVFSVICVHVSFVRTQSRDHA